MSSSARNLGRVDRVIRILLGIALAMVIVWQYFGNFVNLALFAISALLIYTGLSATCPVYKVIGKNTAKAAKAKPRKR